MNDIMIKIDHVSKKYRLGAIGGTTLRDDLQRLGAKLRKKEDPTTQIGTNTVDIGKEFLALDDISFEVKRGEAVGIIGHNGAGKSTLLKLLSRVTAPTEGTLSYNGRIASMLEVGTGFHPELTGRENVYMNGAILGMTKTEIDSKFDQIVEFAEMERFIDTPVKRYSSGMYVKLAFAVAAHLDSEIMIMDEVLAVGDMKFQQKCLGRMGDAANNEGRTVLYVSHNMNTIRQLCTRCIVLDHGKIIFDGDVEKAIGIYMEKNSNIENTDIDLSNQRMKHLSSETKLKMTRINILNKKKCLFKNGEKLNFKLSLHAYDNLDDIRFRFEIRYLDDTPIGTAQCGSLPNLKKDEDISINMSFDTSYLTRGKYKALFVIFSMNEFGTYFDYDAIYPTFTFEIEDNNQINWNSNHWGHIRFKDIEIL